MAIWSVLEPALGIIAACITTYRPLFKNWGFGWNSTKRDGDSPGNYRLSGINRPNRVFKPIPGQPGHTAHARRSHFTDELEDGEFWNGSDQGINVKRTVQVDFSSERAASSHDDERYGVMGGGGDSPQTQRSILNGDDAASTCPAETESGVTIKGTNKDKEDKDARSGAA